MKNKMRAAIYARVSAEDQDCAIQLDQLRGLAERQAWQAEEYTEKLSGKEGNKRPQLDRLMADARLRKFDVVIVWKLDRFGRSTLDTLTNIKALDSYKIRFFCPSQNIDTDIHNPMARAMLQMIAVFAELERAFIVERTVMGQRTYRADHKAGKIGLHKHSKSGKDLPVGRPRVVFDRRRIRELSAKGGSVRQIAKQLGIGAGTVHRALKA